MSVACFPIDYPSEVKCEWQFQTFDWPNFIVEMGLQNWLSSRIFSGEAKSIVMQISIVMLIFLLSPDKILGRGKISEGRGKLFQGGRPPYGK